MIWFGKGVRERLFYPAPRPTREGDEVHRMELALRAVAERSPHLSGTDLAEALAHTGLVDRETALRLLPLFPHFDADRIFSDALRALSFRGPAAAEEFRARMVRVFADLTGGEATLGEAGPEPVVRFRHGGREGIVLAHPQVAFTLGGKTLETLRAAVDEMPDALVVVARNFQDGTRDQLRALLDRTEVPGTMVTVNLLLGMRAAALRFQPSPERVLDLLGAGRPLRTQDVAVLAER
jgi:hypothetical protein